MLKILKLTSRKIIFFSAIFSAIVCSVFATNVDRVGYAQEMNVIKQTTNESEGSKLKENYSQDLELYSTLNTPTYSSGTLKGAENYVNRKLGDVVGFFQSIIRPFTYVAFILSAITLILGVLTSSKHKFAGVIGMGVSVLVYILVMYAPSVVEYLGAWLLT